MVRWALLVHWASLLEGTAIDRSGGVWLGEAMRWMTRASADRIGVRSIPRPSIPRTGRGQHQRRG